jgi:hypothetical protein
MALTCAMVIPFWIRAAFARVMVGRGHAMKATTLADNTAMANNENKSLLTVYPIREQIKEHPAHRIRSEKRTTNGTYYIMPARA